MAVDRRAVLAGLAGLGVAGLSACGSGQAETNGGGGVTLKHKFGTTVIAKRPQRIVSLGTTDHDAALALGVVPIAIANFVGTPTGVGPWAAKQLGSARPQLYLNGSAGVSVESVAKLRPDLILSVQNDLTQDRYDKLSQLAPVVAPPAGYIDWGVPWQLQTQLIGSALGQRPQADTLVAAVEARFVAAAKAHPGFAGKTAVIASVYSGASGTYNAYTRQDARMRFMAGLGLKPAPKVDALGATRFTVPISREKIDLMEADLVAIIAFDDAAGRAVDADLLFKDLAVSKRKAVIRMSLKDEGLALSCNTILSIPYGLDIVVPKMAAILR
jgi:iron complex transport system substrate-binding protein